MHFRLWLRDLEPSFEFPWELFGPSCSSALMASLSFLFFAFYTAGFVILFGCSAFFLIKTLRIRKEIIEKNFHDKGVTSFSRISWIIGLVVLSVILIGEIFYNLTITIGPFLGRSNSHRAIAHIPPFFFGFSNYLLLTVWRFFIATFTAEKKPSVHFFQKQPFRMIVGFAAMWIIASALFLVALIDIGAFTEDMEFVEYLGLERYRPVASSWRFIPLTVSTVLILLFSFAIAIRSLMMRQEPLKKNFLWRSVALVIGSIAGLVGIVVPGDYMTFIGSFTKLVYLLVVIIWEHFLVTLLVRQLEYPESDEEGGLEESEPDESDEGHSESSDE